MKSRNLCISLFFTVVSLIVLTGCKPMSTSVKGHDCKMNGGFETLSKGLPVNWWYYSMETVPSGDFDITTDTMLFKEGKRSLRFNVRSCEPIGGWHSPGFFEEFKVQPGETYKVSFWIMSDGCFLRVSVGAGMKGNPGPSETKVNQKMTVSEWMYFEYYFDIPEANDNIRFEANILSPGTIWFDDVRIEGINNKSELKLYPYRGSEECK